MDGIDIVIAGYVGDLREQATRDAQRIASLELEVIKYYSSSSDEQSR